MSSFDTPVCGAMYIRQTPTGSMPMACTYFEHDGDHSWEAVREADAVTTRVDYSPTAVQAFLDSITRGEMDPYIEAILAVGHNRKRALRNVVGFGHIAPRSTT